ncbi:hypothetical protein HT031_006236 [Scenedesmus sp. PABB004]|nr:hypothetical protein HT031_006236 [Scenedesmus sp. PABB004]
MAASEVPVAALLDKIESLERRLDRQQDALAQACAAQSAPPPALESVDAFLQSYFGGSAELAGHAEERSGSGSAAAAGALEGPALRRQHSAPAGPLAQTPTSLRWSPAALSAPVLALSPLAEPLGSKRRSEPLVAAVADARSGTAGSPGEPLDRGGDSTRQRCKRSRSNTAAVVAGGGVAAPTFPPWLLQRARATLAPLSSTAAAALRAQQLQVLLGTDATGMPLPVAPTGAPALLPVGLAGTAPTGAPSSAATTAAAAAPQPRPHGQPVVQVEPLPRLGGVLPPGGFVRLLHDDAPLLV